MKVRTLLKTNENSINSVKINKYLGSINRNLWYGNYSEDIPEKYLDCEVLHWSIKESEPADYSNIELSIGIK